MVTFRRKAVRKLNQCLNALKLEKHPDKTFIGKIEIGFDFLGDHFAREGLSVAEATVEKFVARATRFYEQERGKPDGCPALRAYVRRWLRWAQAGGLPVILPDVSVAGFPLRGLTAV